MIDGAGGSTPQIVSEDENEREDASASENEVPNEGEAADMNDLVDAELNVPVGGDPAQVDPDMAEAVQPDPPPVPHRQSVNDRLRKEAKSLSHQLSHLPKNPFCQSCTMGKMKEKYGSRRTLSLLHISEPT
mgnify:CR=1 FL=1